MKKKTKLESIKEWFKDLPESKLIIMILAGVLVLFLIGLAITLKIEGDKYSLEVKYEYKDLPISVQGLGGSTEDYLEAMNRIMNLDQPAVEDESENFNTGLGFYTTIDAILGRRLNDGNNDNGNGWQCSRYTAWLATAQWSYNQQHPDYGPVNGKDIADWLVKYYDFKYIDKPVEGAIGSGGFNTRYGHTAMYLYSTGDNTAMVNDANFVPLTVATHNMNIEGWVWVVPSSYEPKPEPQPTPEPEPETDSCKERNVYFGDTLGKIMYECTGEIKWGEAMNDYAKHWYSTKFNKNLTVYDGWTSINGVGLFAEDYIVYVP